MHSYKYIIKKKLLSERGQAAVILAFIIVVLLGITALVIDVGSLYQKRGFYQNVSDSASLAGAQELPESREYAVAAAVDYADKNNVDISYDCRNHTAEDVEISQTYAHDDTITVTLSNREAPLYFARIFGKDTVNISASATAMAASPVNIYGVVPWAAVIHIHEDDEDDDWREWLWSEAGDEKVISGELEDTDFIAWDTTEHPGNWNQRYKDRIINGYQDPLEKGDLIFTREINIAQTVNAVEDRVENWDSFSNLAEYNDDWIMKLVENDDQFVIVPLIYDTVLQEEWGKNPKKKPEWPEVWVEIEAFAPFIITEITTGHGHGHGHGSKTEVKGRFIHQALIINNDEVEAFDADPPVGLKVIRLIK